MSYGHHFASIVASVSFYHNLFSENHMAPLEPNLALIFIRWYFTEFYMTLHVVFGADRKFNLNCMAKNASQNLFNFYQNIIFEMIHLKITIKYCAFILLLWKHLNYSTVPHPPTCIR